MVSIIKLTLDNTDYATPKTLNLKTVKGDSIEVHSKLGLTIAIPCLGGNYSFTFYITDVNDNILGLDFLEDRHKHQLQQLDSKRKLHRIHFNTQQFTRSPVLAVCLDLPQIADTALRKTMEQHSSISGDAAFNTPRTNNTTHLIAVLNQPNFCTPRKHP